MQEPNHLIMVEYEPRHWQVMYPAVVFDNDELFKKGRDLHASNPKEAERIYRQVMATCGELHIEALCYLGMILNSQSAGRGLTYIVQAYTHSRLLFPNEFKEGRDVLPYSCRGNAFVLTSYYAMGSELIKVSKNKEALAIFEFLFLIDPEDVYGAGKWIPQLKKVIKEDEEKAKIVKNN
jgi:hypothetical protein